MSEKKNSPKNNLSPDWLMHGVLTKIGETFDRLTGRNWQPSSSLATSELIERLKKLLDAEAQNLGAKGTFVPHNIKLKMQWDKFSTDAEQSLKTLENELLTAAIDHINDNLYHTYAPLKIEVKPDYFTEGVKLLVSFDDSSENEGEAEIRVTVPGMKAEELMPPESPRPETEIFIARFEIGGVRQERKLRFENNRRLSVGRTKENDLALDDPSVSKFHAALVLDPENRLLVADTGSTNGTFINGERISYGKALAISAGTRIKFGTIEVSFEYVQKPPPILIENEVLPENDSVVIDGFEFKTRSESASENDISENDATPAEKSAENRSADVSGEPTEVLTFEEHKQDLQK